MDKIKNMYNSMICKSMIYKLLGIFIILFFMLIILIDIVSLDIIVVIRESINWYFFFSVSSYLLIVSLAVLLYRLILKTNKNYFTITLIFIYSFILRAMVSFAIRYIPTNDFTNYYNFGVNMVNKDYKAVLATVAGYDLPTFAGMAIFNGLIAQIFGTTVLGAQVGNSVMTSLIAVMIYILCKSYKENYAVIAALIFSVYPSNIIMTQVTTNQHGATLMYLIGFHMLIKAVNSNTYKKVIYALASGTFLVFGNLFHPSAITSILAICFFSVTLIISFIKNFKMVYSVVIILLICLFSYKMISVASNNLFVEMGISDGAQHGSRLAKVVVGLNYKSGGSYSWEDYDLIARTPLEEKDKLSLSIIKERLGHPIIMTKLFFMKLRNMWGTSDATFIWYLEGVEQFNKANINTITAWQNNIAIKFVQGYRIIDFYFVVMLYILAIIGSLQYIKTKGNDSLNLLIWVLCGWIGAHFFIEVQSRYRYFAMPIITMFAGIGFIGLEIYVKDRIQRSRSVKAQSIPVEGR